MPLLQVKNLKTYYQTARGYVKAVDGVNFQIEEGEVFGLAGESGCGKTTVALSIIRLLPPGGRIIDGKIIFNDKNILTMSEEDIRKIRWKKIAIVFQGAMNALNPVIKVGDQIVEAITTHENVSKEDAWKRTEKLFEMVGIDPSRAKDYPHEFSGGMKQRVMIAMALACNPQLLIADEPATALDVIVQAQILKLMRELQRKMNLSMMLITHDLSIIAETCNKVAIMYAGKIVEYADTKRIFRDPQHPYTRGLINAFPSIRGPKRKLISIPGTPPDLLNPPSGCRFHPRCPYTNDKCKKIEPELKDIGERHYVACHMSW
ncbi:MAG: ABC transporter ATP-binding protein [archaeon GBS-70-058]|nr:ABC transporter ATP-binding protein [Candidatus Culexarchaeum nevadense]